ncbi:hypothetical protein VM1G_09860 [Cytospora mali]|uniref:Uncharacterized protein n=1 Tax=Cytospora mali TaxID=578113 RepID=A0A194WDF0_CYTMA|nr:hypothetical protein VM1G_09860 [Valsa mali]
MYSYRGPRHYSYECKTGLQERPYNARPSRTQQLLNPKLAPKLTNDAPDLATKKKGVADEELAKKEAERARKRDLEDDDEPGLREPNSTRQRSISVDSVSSISTRSSKSPPPPRRARDLATAVKDALPAQSETTDLETTDMEDLLITVSVLLLELDGTRPTLVTDGPKNVTSGTIRGRQAVQVSEIDVVRMREPTEITGIDTMARTKTEKCHLGLVRSLAGPLRRNPGRPGSAV